MLPEPFQRRRAAGSRAPEGGVLVTRPGFWGNWLVPGDPGRVWIKHWHPRGFFCFEGTLPFPVGRAEAVQWHAQWLNSGELPAAFLFALDDAAHRILAEKRAATLARLHELRGRRLGCWCSLPAAGAPDVCHRATLAALANAEVLTCAAA